jgi:hypothetical protein
LAAQPAALTVAVSLQGVCVIDPPLLGVEQACISLLFDHTRYFVEKKRAIWLIITFFILEGSTKGQAQGIALCAFRFLMPPDIIVGN